MLPCSIIFDAPERDTRVVAYADRYALESSGSRHGELYFPSLGGESMAVRAVLAALASRRSVTVEGSTQHSWLMFPWSLKVKSRTARLPSGLAHGIARNEVREREMRPLLEEMLRWRRPGTSGPDAGDQRRARALRYALRRTVRTSSVVPVVLVALAAVGAGVYVSIRGGDKDGPAGGIRPSADSAALALSCASCSPGRHSGSRVAFA